VRERTLRILLLEDSPEDAELIERALGGSSFTFELRRVETREDFRRELSRYRPDVILSDHALPSFGGREALNLALECAPRTPGPGPLARPR